MINRKELLDALSSVLPSAATSSVVKELECFRFEKDTIRTANGASIQTVIQFHTGLDCCVSARILFKLLNSMVGDEVDLSVSKGYLFFKSGTSKGKLKLVPSKLFPKQHKMEEDVFRGLSGGFKDALELCRFSMSKDSSRPGVCGIKVEKDCVMSTDTYRVTKYFLESPIEYLIRDRMLEVLLTFDKILGCQIFSKHLFFEVCDGCVVSGPLLVPLFPNVSTYFEDFSVSSDYYSLPIKDMIGAVNRLSFLSEGEYVYDRIVELNFTEDAIILSSEEEKCGKLEERIPVKGGEKSPIVKIYINPVFLLDVFKYDVCKVRLVGDRFIEFRSDSFCHIAILGEVVE